MPMYTYKCQKCNLQLETTHKMDESPELRCPSCKTILQKVFKLAGVSFKGGGWGSSR